MSETVALSVLALELPVTADELAHRYPDLITEDFLGRRAISRTDAKQILADHRAQQQQLADQRAETIAQRRRQGDPVRAKVRALLARTDEPTGNALVDMLSRDPDNAFARSSAAMDEQLSGVMTMHSRTERGIVKLREVGAVANHISLMRHI